MHGDFFCTEAVHSSSVLQWKEWLGSVVLDTAHKEEVTGSNPQVGGDSLSFLHAVVPVHLEWSRCRSQAEELWPWNLAVLPRNLHCRLCRFLNIERYPCPAVESNGVIKNYKYKEECFMIPCVSEDHHSNIWKGISKQWFFKYVFVHRDIGIVNLSLFHHGAISYIYFFLLSFF